MEAPSSIQQKTVGLAFFSEHCDALDLAVQSLLERIKSARGPIHVLDLGGNSIGQGGADAIKDALAKLMDLKVRWWFNDGLKCEWETLLAHVMN